MRVRRPATIRPRPGRCRARHSQCCGTPSAHSSGPSSLKRCTSELLDRLGIPDPETMASNRAMRWVATSPGLDASGKAATAGAVRRGATPATEGRPDQAPRPPNQPDTTGPSSDRRPQDPPPILQERHGRLKDHHRRGPCCELARRRARPHDVEIDNVDRRPDQAHYNKIKTRIIIRGRSVTPACPGTV